MKIKKDFNKTKNEEKKNNEKENMIRQVNRIEPYTRFWVYFGLFEETASQKL